MTYIPDIKLLSQKPVLYAISDGRDVVSYGVGEGAARLITKTVITLGVRTGDFISVDDAGVTSGTYSVRYCEFDARMKIAFPVPAATNAAPDENVERLLQALHTWQHGAKPRRDEVRGGGVYFGGWIGGSAQFLTNLLALYGWFDEVKKPWPPSLIGHALAPVNNAKLLALHVHSTTCVMQLAYCNKQTTGSIQYATCTACATFP